MLPIYTERLTRTIHQTCHDVYILQSTEVKNANAMELESLKRQLSYLEESNVEVKKLVTDRHTQVSAYMAQEKPNIKHTYHVWHLAKGKKRSNSTEIVTGVYKALSGQDILGV